VISVANRGLRLADKPAARADSARRGWGLKLIQGLMDEVVLDETDDRTVITMTKNIAR
jgi:anti-sigma regulatory factor (Ser/Thr protein kinase)